MLLENESIRLRAVEPEDLEKLYKWENNPQLWLVGNGRNPYSHFTLKQYILNSDKDIYENKQLRLMIVLKENNETIGTIDLFDFDIHNSRISLGIYVENKFQRKGYATNSLRLVQEYVFDYLKINQIYAFVAEKNTPSIHIFEQEKFEKNGILKNWIKTLDDFQNIFVFQKFRENYLLQKNKIT